MATMTNGREQPLKGDHALLGRGQRERIWTHSPFDSPTSSTALPVLFQGLGGPLSGQWHIHPVSITRFPLRRFSPGLGCSDMSFSLVAAKIFQGLGPKRRESPNGDRVYGKLGVPTNNQTTKQHRLKTTKHSIRQTIRMTQSLPLFNNPPRH